MKPILILTLSFFLTLPLHASTSVAQDQGFLYGIITTVDKETYEGVIRWGKEEAFWTDVFNASKTENSHVKYLSDAELDELEKNQYGNTWRGWNRNGWCTNAFWNDDRGDRSKNDYSTSSFTHQFSCRFGEIKKIIPKSSRTVEVELQGGFRFEVNGDGYNDIGTDVHILDKETGEIALNWRRIDQIEFRPTPEAPAKTFGNPVYGTVQTYGGSFTGLIQWDHEERLSTDKIDGDSDDGRVSIAFENIKSIEHLSNRSRVTLKSGRELELNGTNDVNSENRGIIVTDESGMMVDIPWTEFKKLTIEALPVKVIQPYSQFSQQKALTAKVVANGKNLQGYTIFDLDEAYDFELFQGKNGDIEYTLPIKSIRKLEVKSPKSVEVTLIDGRKISLRDTQDTGTQNQGVLVFNGGKNPSYIPWAKISDITFNP